MKDYLIAAGKIILSLLILAALFWFAFRNNIGDFFKMLAAPKRWDMLIAAWVVVLLAVLITFIRWCYLVRAVGIPMTIYDSVRIGFLGYLFNLAPFGIVGGDIFKTYILAHEWPGNRAKALASVFVDRIIGLEILFLVASLGVVTGVWNNADPQARAIRIAVVSVTVVSTIGLAICMIPGILNGPWFKTLERLPKVGHAFHSLLESLRLYRSNTTVLVLSGLGTVPVHLLFSASIFLLARGLRFESLGPLDFMAIYAVPGVLTVIPLPAGPVEGGMSFMYALAVKLAMGAAVVNQVDLQKGLMIALAYKLIAVSLAIIGMVFLFFGRREVGDVMTESGEGGDGIRDTITT